MSLRKNTLFAALIGVVGLVAVGAWEARASGSQEPGKLIVTTADLRQEYEIVGVFVQYQEASAMSFKGDPIENAIKKGEERFLAGVKAMGADAVVGYRIEFASPSGKEEGRVVVYGTAVRLKK